MNYMYVDVISTDTFEEITSRGGTRFRSVPCLYLPTHCLECGRREYRSSCECFHRLIKQHGNYSGAVLCLGDKRFATLMGGSLLTLVSRVPRPTSGQESSGISYRTVEKLPTPTGGHAYS